MNLGETIPLNSMRTIFVVVEGLDFRGIVHTPSGPIVCLLFLVSMDAPPEDGHWDSLD